MATAESFSKAHDNYLKGMSHSDNAAACGVSRQTIARWVKENDWEGERDALVETTRNKFIEQESDRIVRDKSEVDTEHRAIVNRLRQDYKELVMTGRKCSAEDLSILSAKIRVGSEILKLEREVLGLNKIRHIDKPTFPTAFAITLETKQGPITIDPKRLTMAALQDLEDALPNQDPESFTSVQKDIDQDDEFIDDTEYYPDDDESPTMKAIQGK